ncbi:hypothetical protein BsWGS_05382 [Bradybaena similaris]
MAASVFQNVEQVPPIEVFQLTKLFNECQSPLKVNLGAGAYQDENGKPWVLPIVRAVEFHMASDKTLNHEYLPVAGLPDFRNAAIQLLLGTHHKVIMDSKVEGFQAIGGTGAVRLAAAFLKSVLHFDIVYISNPSWENHKGVFRSVGFSQIREYRYWRKETKDVNFSGMCEDLLNAPPNSVIILHAVAHNPTGVDLTKDQWKEICTICKEQKLIVLMDCAYQGFASGDLDNDAWAVRYFADQDIDMFIAQSFSKNFGLYNERVGNLIVISKDETKIPEIRSQMEIQIRIMWSNPANHGARIVATVLNNKVYFSEWRNQVSTMATRIKNMRQKLVDCLKRLGTPGNWDHITNQIGMFSFTGLTENQVQYLLSKYIFLLKSGRISMAGLTSKNVSYVAKIIDEAVRAHPRAAL